MLIGSGNVVGLTSGKGIPLAGLAAFTEGPGRELPAVKSGVVHVEDLRDIDAARRGDGDAYARLVQRYQAAIARQMWRFSRQPETHEQLVQDTFVEAYFSLDGYKARSPFEHWLRRIATRVGYRYWKDRERTRNRGTVPIDTQPEPARSEQDHLEPREAAELLHEVLQQLSPRDRLVLTLMYLEDCSVKETAERTGWTVTMVKVQAHRARARLRRLLEQRGEMP